MMRRRACVFHSCCSITGGGGEAGGVGDGRGLEENSSGAKRRRGGGGRRVLRLLPAPFPAINVDGADWHVQQVVGRSSADTGTAGRRSLQPLGSGTKRICGSSRRYLPRGRIRAQAARHVLLFFFCPSASATEEEKKKTDLFYCLSFMGEKKKKGKQPPQLKPKLTEPNVNAQLQNSYQENSLLFKRQVLRRASSSTQLLLLLLLLWLEVEYDREKTKERRNTLQHVT